MKRILIADDELAVRQLLDLVLRGQGYEVMTAQNGDELVRMAQDHVPDLMLVDLMMPVLDGYEAIRQMRNDTRTAHVPMVILTARSTPNDVVVGFESGADDYVTKPFNIPELLARIKGHLRRASQRPVRSPLTDLPGNVLLTEELKFRLKKDEPFALLYLDLDNFKAFNDTYGFARGDRVIKLVAEVVTNEVHRLATEHDFIGHIGGDDFAILTHPDMVAQLCKSVIETFDQRIRMLYDPKDLELGYLPGHDRQGVPRRFPIVSISIGVVDTNRRIFANHEEVSRTAAEMKQFAKQQVGSSYAIDVRGSDQAYTELERRGQNQPPILLLSVNDTFLDTLHAPLEEYGYRTLEAHTILDANALLAHDLRPQLICADARLGSPLWEFAQTLMSDTPSTVLIVLSEDAEDEELAFTHGARAFIQLPFQVQRFLSCIVQFVRREE
ncbi:MAG: Two-component response regulator, PleD family [Chloroflexi bacterium AL-W]|nr:Two-component response regulator, PleD family [Chloroflexi bacterium AL-N1]NOK70582.1 Two-component response regulator, PleD family [Chloroflexi bacterium AL-N10]NOK77574.1 Two-component response regulator, PleD family [Chloroflexi bacterium AL-N5]NOK84425.1 Two-component response regulator, PleD family [Chloroflexi bacterium AL-W]NOK92314.1 Two-component response regulator, PleD family [Chloroflexi bacterium AL-N15]